MRKKSIFQIGLVIIVLLAGSGCQEKMSPGFLGSGTLEATEVRVSALTIGTIQNLTKSEGDRTAKDELLAEIDVEKLVLQKRQIEATFKEIDAGEITADAAIAQSEENYANVKTNHKRIKTLYEKGSATQKQFDDISTKLTLTFSQMTSARAQKPLLESRREQLKANLAIMERQIADGKVFSPIKGVVMEKYAEPGEIAVMGGALYKIADLDNFWLKIYMAEPDLDKVVIGKPVKVKIDALDEPLKGKVAWTSPEAEFTPKNVQTRKARAELVYAVKVTIDEAREELKIGMPAEVHIAD